MKMEKKIEVLVTSGGTISEIDEVRHIGNSSKGTTGALIAEEFLFSGAKVHYLHQDNSVMPFTRNLTIDFRQPLEDEIKRITPFYEKASSLKENLKSYTISTFEQYMEKVESILKNNPINVVVLAAAVLDYGAEKVNEKISSELDKLNIELTRTPKVISYVKKWKPDVFQVGFKLLSNAEYGQLVETAYQHGKKNNSDLTVANSKTNGGLALTSIITPEKNIVSVERKCLARQLVHMVYERL